MPNALTPIQLIEPCQLGRRYGPCLSVNGSHLAPSVVSSKSISFLSKRLKFSFIALNHRVLFFNYRKTSHIIESAKDKNMVYFVLNRRVNDVLDAKFCNIPIWD